MSQKKNAQIVRDTISSLAGFEGFIKEGNDGHGVYISFMLFGREYSYTYDKTPKAQYTMGQTRKGVRHAVLTKGAMAGIDQDTIYKATEWKSSSKVQRVTEAA